MGLKVSYVLEEYDGFGQLLASIDNRIRDLQQKYNALSQRQQALSVQVERIKRLEEALSKLVGSEIKSIREIDFMGLKVVVGARLVDELAVVEEVLTSVSDTLMALQKVRDVIDQLAKSVGESSGIKILVETINGIPVRLLLRET